MHTPGSAIWSQFRPEDIRRLRLIGRQALIKNGVTPQMLDHKTFAREVDKWLESRLEDTLELYLKSLRDKGL